MHYGQGDIQFDRVSKGYDYYGTVVNTAARIESVCHGGQVGVSQGVFDAVHKDLPEVVWADLGVQPLRGLGQGIQLYQALPEGPLASRTFPPLRLDRQQDKEDKEALEGALEVVTAVQSHESSMGTGTAKPNSVAPAASVVSTENWRWVETHPLVMHGDISVDELRKDYAVAFCTLSTLLTTQTDRVREQTLRILCERLHVPNHGAHGATLTHTLCGLVQRVLPATVVNAQQLLRGCLTRQNSKQSSPASPALTLQATSFRNT
eukprot:EG_transcript_23131